MTIAACYVSSEGVVFAADSTSTILVPNPGSRPIGALHHFNYAQKIFEIGAESTLALAIWGMGNLGEISHRTLIAQFADTLRSEGASSMTEIAERWSRHFWAAYSQRFATELQRVRQLLGQALRTDDENAELAYFSRTLSGGFCLGGHLLHDRTPSAMEILYNPALNAPPVARPLRIGASRFWGWENLLGRLLYGIDWQLLESILQSGKWHGTHEDLFALMAPYCLGQPRDLPIREAVDWLHASIYTTIKTMKFSHMPPVCGGPVEIAVITTDRPFRWVRHKRLGAAVAAEGGSDA